MGQPARCVLPDIGHIEAERAAVTDRLADRRLGVADHDPYVRDTRIADRLQAIKQNRLVRDRQQLFGGGVGDRPEPAPRPPRQDQGLHGEWDQRIR